MWAGSFWEKDHFNSSAQLRRKSPKFLTWYQTYDPPALDGLTVGEATREDPRQHLSEQQIAELPNELPLTAGRLHFARPVSAGGEIQILKEPWKVSRSLAGQYVLATLGLRRQELLIYHRRSTRAEAHLIRRYEYEIDEAISRCLPNTGVARVARRC